MTISTITNSLEIEKSNVQFKLDDKYAELSDNSLIYPGTDVIVECSFNNDEITKLTFMDIVGKFFSRNLISIIVLILSVILCIYEVYSVKNIEKRKMQS